MSHGMLLFFKILAIAFFFGAAASLTFYILLISRQQRSRIVGSEPAVLSRYFVIGEALMAGGFLCDLLRKTNFDDRLWSGLLALYCLGLAAFAYLRTRITNKKETL
ncbi:MAG: hypothetical protein LAP21_03435 [Acidobacteriia bacterium]|nr:hypothetical protein [Terriglobia bacterium]